MIVVSDTSPLNYLILIDASHVLSLMYGRVVVPRAVAEELTAPGAPEKTRTWFAARPAWIEVHAVAPEAAYPELDRGESEAIALAKSLKADLLLVDERRATRIARKRENLAATGTLGVLFDAAMLGLLDLAESLRRLEAETTFHAPAKLYNALLKSFWQRKTPPQDA